MPCTSLIIHLQLYILWEQEFLFIKFTFTQYAQRMILLESILYENYILSGFLNLSPSLSNEFIYFKVMFKVYNEIEHSDHKIYRVTEVVSKILSLTLSVGVLICLLECTSSNGNEFTEQYKCIYIKELSL